MAIITFIHVLAGSVAIGAGALALFARKGARVHIVSGHVFLGSMLVMALAGAALAVLLDQSINIYAAALTSYLVITSWLSVQSRFKGNRYPEMLALMFIGLVAVVCLLAGYDAVNSQSGLKDGYGADAYFFIGGVACLAAILDVTYLLRKKIAYSNKVARHLWRMCFAYFIAVGSLFTGPGATVFPRVIRETGVLNVPEPFVLLLMVFWLVKTLSGRRFRKQD